MSTAAAPTPQGQAAPTGEEPGATTPEAPAPRRTLLGRVLTAVLWTLLAAILLLLIAMVGVPRVMGWVPLTVLSSSMEPTYPAGSQIVVERVETQDDFDALDIGDVITFMPNPDDGTLVTHRIVQTVHNQDGSRSLITQGDANPSPDPRALDLTQIRGAVRYHIPYAGYIAQRLNADQKSTGAVVLAVGLFGYAAYHLARSGLDLRRSRASAAGGDAAAAGEATSSGEPAVPVSSEEAQPAAGEEPAADGATAHEGRAHAGDEAGPAQERPTTQHEETRT